MIEWIIVITVGLALGSFACAMSWRLPRHESLAMARSHCVSCENPLSAVDLVPLISWLILRGRCRQCRAPIHWRYPVIELLTAILIAILYSMLGLSPLWALLSLLSVALIIMAVLDISHGFLPDILQAICLLLALPYHWTLSHSPMSYILGSTFGLGLGLLLHYGYYALRRRHGLGWGDVKFFVIAGAWLGWEALPTFWLLAGLLGVITGLIWQMKHGRGRFPFGPALAASLYLSLLLQLSGLTLL